MFKPALIALLLTFTFTTLPLHAQAQSAPWPPDPDDIFAQGVEIIASRELEFPAYKGRRIDTFGFDGREYPWPEEISPLSSLRRVSEPINGYVYITFMESGSGYRDWRLNLETGEYTAYEKSTLETLCGEIPIERLNYQKWFFSLDAETGKTQLCEFDTGRLTQPLPLGYEWNIETANWGMRELTAEVSPDGQYVVFMGEDVDDYLDRSRLIRVFSYHLSTNTLLNLGEFAGRRQIEFEGWIDNQVLIATSETEEFSYRNIYIADISSPENLELAASNLRYSPPFYDNPPRYEVVPNMTNESIGWHGGYGNGPHCQLDIFYLTTRQARKYDLGELCTPSLPIGNTSARLYRYVPLDLSQPATLISFDLETKERVDLFQGEIEQILSISPDGQYVIMVMDNNGRIDAPPDTNPLVWTDFNNAYVAVIDLETRQIIKTFDMPLNFYSGVDPQTEWFEENAFRLESMDGAGGGPPTGGRTYIRWVWLDEPRIIGADYISPDYLFSPDQKYLLVNQGERIHDTITPDALKIINFATGDVLSVTWSVNSQDYFLSGKWLDNSTIEVTVTPGNPYERVAERLPASVIYTIRTPQLDTED